MSEAEESSRAEEASRWFTVVTNPAISLDDLQRFRTWRTDPANAAAFERIERMWGRAEALSSRPAIEAATADVLAKYPPKPLPKTEFKLRPLMAGGAAVIVAGIAAVLVSQEPWVPTYSTPVGGQRLEQLADGSRVRLNTETKLQVRFSDGERRVRLLKGEAFFEVAHEASRPFVVEADDARVRALGTKFDVHRSAGQVDVTLIQGRVEVRRDGDAAATTLAPGQGLTVTPQGVTKPQARNTADTTDWTTGQLNFSGVPLEAAVAEVNRYTTRKIVVKAPAAIRRERVSGRFDTGDTDDFVAALSAVYGLKVTSSTSREIRLSPG